MHAGGKKGPAHGARLALVEAELRPSLLGSLRRRVRDGALAEDLLQEALLVGLESLETGRLRRPESLPAFVCGVVRNLSLASRRRYRREVALSESIESPDPSPEDALLAGELRRLVRRTLSDLSPRDRTLLRALYLEERERSVVRDELRLTPAQIDVASCRARQRFARLWTRDARPTSLR